MVYVCYDQKLLPLDKIQKSYLMNCRGNHAAFVSSFLNGIDLKNQNHN